MGDEPSPLLSEALKMARLSFIPDTKPRTEAQALRERLAKLGVGLYWIIAYDAGTEARPQVLCSALTTFDDAKLVLADTVWRNGGCGRVYAIVSEGVEVKTVPAGTVVPFVRPGDAL